MADQSAPVAETVATEGATETPKRRRASGPRKGPTVVVSVNLMDADGNKVDTKGLRVQVTEVSRDTKGFAMRVISGEIPEGLHFMLEVPAASDE